MTNPDPDRLAANFVEAIRAMRTQVITSIYNTPKVIGNALKNAAAYHSARPMPASPNFGIADLKDARKGKPAIVIGAGPSLAKNRLCLLAAGLRDRFTVIATQTVLKPMLAMGVRPHFVCALDYHPICARFYEGLTFEDVDGVHLVCQVEANPIIPELWPGVLRMPGEPYMDTLADTPKDYGRLSRGATVSHMGHYLARYIGCDPVIHIGQDLGYTDGLYYGAGASIHDVWQGELSEFRTLEMMEHERIVRNKGGYKAIPAFGGGEVYSDALLITYLELFRQIWTVDIANGLMVIDATEGGADKAPAIPMPLAESMAKYGPSPEVAGRRLIAKPMAGEVAKNRLLANAGRDR